MDAGRAQALFVDALALPPAARGAFLSQECGGDDRLRQEIQSLLEWDARTHSLGALESTTGQADETPILACGDRVGPYEVRATLGRGGMGVVYRARHEGAGRDVALKMARDASLWAGDALRREIAVLARLRRPGLLALEDEGMHEGIPWYAMELVEGVPFRRHTAELAAAGDVAGTLALFARLCDHIAEIHGNGIVHRDLKPENVLVREDGRPVIVDFGLACPWDATEGRERLDAAAPPAGTRSYMAPEQARGSLVDSRADIFAIGRMLQEAMAAVAPDETRPGGIDALLEELLHEQPGRRIGYASQVAARLVALGARSDPGAAAAPAHLHRSRLAGRAPVLERIHERWRSDTSGSLTWILGESGLGKTRLLAELAAWGHRCGRSVIACECVPEAGAPLHLLRPLLRAVAALVAEEGADAEDAECLAILAPYEPTLRGMPEIAGVELVDVDAYDARKRVLWALTRAVERHLGEEHIVVLDDLQWADGLSLEALRHLLAHGLGSAIPVHVAGTARGDEVSPELDALFGMGRAERIHLEPLRPEDIRDIAGDMLASVPSETLVSSLGERADGNPLFVTEYLRTAITLGWLALDGSGRWRFSGMVPDDEELPLPHRIRALAARRLGLLDDAALRVAQLAAVLGRVDEVALLEVEGPDPAGFDVLVQRGIVSLEGTAYRFSHETVRQALVEGLGERAPDVHLRAARAVDGLAEPEKEQRREALGRHWEAAGRLVEARRCYLLAAKHLEKLHARDDAERLYLAYLALAEPATTEAMNARIALGVLITRPDDSLQHFSIVLRDARAAGASKEAAGALINLAWLHGTSGRSRLARSMLERAAALAEAAGERDVLARTHNVRGTVDHHEGNFEAAARSYEQALQIRRELGYRMGQGFVLRNLANIWWQLGKMALSRQLHEEALEIAREQSSASCTMQALSGISAVDFVQGRFDEAAAMLQEALDLARKIRSTGYEALMLGNLAMAELERGGTAVAGEQLRTAVCMLRDYGDRWALALVLCDAARVELREGRLDAAEEMLHEAAALAVVVRNKLAEAIAQTGLGSILRYRGRPNQATEILRSALITLVGLGARVEQGLALVELARCFLASGRDAGALIEEARAIGRELDAPPGSRQGRSVAGLDAAVALQRAGGTLVCGERPEDLPPGIAAAQGASADAG